MVAEELFYGESGTGPAGDLAAATMMAADMVGSMGQGGSLVSLRAADPGLVGGDLTSRVLGDERARAALESLLDEQKGVVTTLLRDNRHLIEALRDALLARNELVTREITEVLEAATARHGAVLDLTDA
jgi:ATP-dependent Zn protease